MKRLLFIWIFFLFLLACNSDDISSLKNATFQKSLDFIFCTVLMPKNERITLKSVINTPQIWEKGTTIRIKFLNGNDDQQKKVKLYASEWLQYANIKFQYVNINEEAEIRIGFEWEGSNGFGSFIGKYALLEPKDKPTLFLGSFKTIKDDQLKMYILHEFGHVLGLEHEHMHPYSCILWNKPVVYAHYARQGLSREEIDEQILQVLSIDQFNYSKYDPHSIMHYSIPKKLTTNGYSVGVNRDLSHEDKYFISKIYPFQDINELSRYKKGNYYFLSSDNKEENIKYFEHKMGRVYNSQVANTDPIYSYHNTMTGASLSTVDFNEVKDGIDNWKYQGIIGYAYKTNRPGTIPVYRYSNGLDYFFTILNWEVVFSPAVRHFNAKTEHIAFYILR